MYRKNWSKASLIELLEYIEQHHCEIKEKLMKLQTLIEQAAELPFCERRTHTYSLYSSDG
jgi:hypothetical protein